MTPLRGWGGIRLWEASIGGIPNATEEPFPSEVFVGENSSKAEMTARLLKERNYNCIRAYFESEYTKENVGDEYWAKAWRWNSDWFNRMLEICKHYDLWLIADYHGYSEPFTERVGWLQFWRDEVIRPFTDKYEKLVWEPCNEPISNILENQSAYQKWVDMCRGLGDKHLIVHSHPQWDIFTFPYIDDSEHNMIGSSHFYYQFLYNTGAWTVRQAEEYAINQVNVILQRIKEAPHITQLLASEMGVTNGHPPDQQVTGSCGYSTTALAHTRKVIELLHKNGEGYCLWTAGAWCPNIGLYGAMNTWGDKVPYPPKIRYKLLDQVLGFALVGGVLYSLGKDDGDDD